VTTHDFFAEVEHPSVPWRQYQLHVPVFYQDLTFISASFLVSTAQIDAILPSPRLKPYRITPWHSVLSVTAYAYRECDLGPYNEVSVGIPVTIDKPTPRFTGILHRRPSPPMSYSHHLPVSTEIARIVGAEFAGYPKFVAQIDFSERDGWLACELKADNQWILTLSGRVLPVRHCPRYRIDPITHRRGYLLRSELVVSERDMGVSKSTGDVRLELGQHPISQELRALNLGRTLGYGYCPQAQAILTPVFESFAAN
jgi:hypothetical protein